MLTWSKPNAILPDRPMSWILRSLGSYALTAASGMALAFALIVLVAAGLYLGIKFFFLISAAVVLFVMLIKSGATKWAILKMTQSIMESRLDAADGREGASHMNTTNTTTVALDMVLILIFMAIAGLLVLSLIGMPHGCLVAPC